MYGLKQITFHFGFLMTGLSIAVVWIQCDQFKYLWSGTWWFKVSESAARLHQTRISCYKSHFSHNSAGTSTSTTTQLQNNHVSYFTFWAFTEDNQRAIMVSLYMLLSDVKQNSKWLESGLPTLGTTIINLTTTSPHQCSITAAADTPTQSITSSFFSQFTLCKQRLHLLPSPIPRGESWVITVT